MKRLVLAAVLALGLGVFAAAPVAAVSEAREAEITYRSIKIVLDGREICPRDAKGNEVEPFILDGTTYLPVRAVADALGLEVRWRGSDSTVMLAGNELEEEYFRVSMVDLPPETPRVDERATGHSGVERVKLGYRDIRLLVDGVIIQPKDAAGNVIEPFILNGTTYLPVRAVADALGLTVDWDSASSTVRLSHWLVAHYAEYEVFDDGEQVLVEEYWHEYDEYGRTVRSRYKYPPIYVDDGLSLPSRYVEQEFSYDGYGRLARTETVRYDESGRNVTATGTVVYEYDAVSGLCLRFEESGSETGGREFGRETRYEYDESGRLVRAVTAREVYWAEWKYDDAGRIIEIRESAFDPMAALGLPFREEDPVRKFSYDENGRLAVIDESGEYPEYITYDVDGRQLSTHWFDMYHWLPWEFTLRYDEIGRLIHTEFSNGGKIESTDDFSFDERGLLVKTRFWDIYGYESEEICTYDANGNPVRFEERRDGSTVVMTVEYVKAGG